jgi:hypothetical protein
VKTYPSLVPLQESPAFSCSAVWSVLRWRRTATVSSSIETTRARHSRSRLPGGTFTVRATVHPGLYARMEVEDNGGPWNQGMIDPSRHHGLDIVRALADEWGINGDRTTRTIWARFDWPE